MKLAEFQDALQQAILTGHTPIIDTLGETPQFRRGARLGVYIDAYRLRLAGFIANDYPVLRDAIGDEEFEALAMSFIDGARSYQPNARWYASALPEFMTTHPRWRIREDRIDLARFERALSDAFDAADAAVLDASAFASVEPEKAPDLCFEFHPSVRLLTLSAGTANAHATLCEGREPSVSNEGHEHVLFWRQGEQCFYRLLEEDEWLAMTQAKDGRRFGEICDLLAFRQNGEDVSRHAAALLLRWLEDELVSAVAF